MTDGSAYASTVASVPNMQKVLTPRTVSFPHFVPRALLHIQVGNACEAGEHARG